MQSLMYDMWYYKYGINTTTHLQNLRMLKVSDITYPKNTVLHWNKGIDTNINVIKNSPYLSNLETAIVNTNVDYHSPYEGKITLKNILKENIIRENSKLEPSFRFIRNSQKLYISGLTPIIEDYGSINLKYKYAIQLLLRYIKYKNVMNTVYNNLGKYEDRRDIIFLEIPDTIPTRNELNRYSQVLNKTYLENLPTYKHLNILDIWMFMNPATYSKSMLSKISNKSKVDVIIGNDINCSIFNLDYLQNLVTEKLPNPNYKNKIGSYNYSMASKLILRVLYALNGMELPKEEEEVILTKDEMAEELGDSNIDPNTETNDTEDEEQVEEDDEVATEVVEKIDNKTVETALNKVKKDCHNIETVNNSKKLVDINKQLEVLVENKAISNYSYNNMMGILEEQYYQHSALDPKVPLIDMLNMDNDNYEIPVNNISTDKVVFNPNDGRTITQDIKTKYLKEQYNKDITRVIYSLQNAGIIVEEHKVKTENNILGGYTEHTLRVRSINGGSSNVVKINLPNINKNGIIKKDGNYYVIRHLQTDLPIRKIDYNVVELSSHYGKVFITKGKYSYDNIGNWLLGKLAKHESVFDLIPGEVSNMDTELPKLYNIFSRCTKSFRIETSRFSFLYPTRFDLFTKIPKETLKSIEERTKTIIAGIDNERPILIDYDNNFYLLDNNKLNKMMSPLETLNINLNDGPIEFAVIDIFKKSIPIGVFLAYHLGLEELIKILNAESNIVDNTRQVPKDGEHYSIQFLDRVYSIKRDYGKCDLILSGLNKLNPILKTISYKALEDKNEFGILATLLELKNIHMTEFKLLDSMFIDPMTLSVLKLMKEPITFIGLLIRSAELLVDDNYKNPNDIQYSIIQGYDRIAGILYKRLVEAVKEYENRTAKNRLALTVAPYDIMNRIFEDSTTVSLDDINPMAGIKQIEDVSRVGHGGRGKDGMARSTRILDDTWIGVISEATKDSTDVGITAYLSANPNIKDTRGRTNSLDKDKANWSNLISTANMIAPFILTDDPKRINFSSIMQTHIIPIQNMRVPYVLTGYESIIPIKSDNRFCITAEDNGIIEAVTKSSVTINYDKLGRMKYKFSNWTTKEESGVCYTHRLVPNVAKNDRVLKDDTLVYNTSFFSPSIFNKRRVLYKQGDMVNVGLVEDIETYEDSARISKRLNSRLGTKVSKIKSFLINCEDSLTNLINIGSQVTPNDILFTKADKLLTDIKDPKTLEIMKKLNSSSPKAKVTGEVVKIQFFYNCELNDMSDSIKNYILESDKILLEISGYTGKVDSGYKINGNPLQQGYIELKIYIEITDSMSIGDKAIIGNQLKFTVGDVYNHEIKGEDGTPVDLLFSMRSIGARIVESPMLLGTTSTLLDKIGKLASDIYFNKK